MRKLASIQRIINLEPIEGKDKIELATILGWKVIVEKGFNIGDLIIYIEYDSILPVKPEFEFLRSRCYSQKYYGFRIRCMKMGGVFSEGIVFPIDLVAKKYHVEGKDVTDILGIRKYDPEYSSEVKEVNKNKFLNFLFRFRIFRFIFQIKKQERRFFTHLVLKTDETRLQAIPEILNQMDYKNLIITEKLDGCSATYIYHNKRFYICSRNIIVNNKHNCYYRIAEKYKLKEILKKYKNIAIQGEIVGPGISNGSGKNIYELKEIEFYIFNIVNTKTKNKGTLSDWVDFLARNDLKGVPLLYIGDDLKNKTIEEWESLAIDKSVLYDCNREGIVVKDNQRSFKVINKDFLLEHNK